MPKIIVFEFYCQEEFTHIFVIRPNLSQPEIFNWKVKKRDLREWVQSRLGSTDAVSKLDEVDFNEEFKDVVNYIGQQTSPEDIIYIVPHDMLHAVPFHALQLNGQYLAERNPIVYVPSAAILQHCFRHRKVKRGNKAFVAAYSPSSAPLAHAIQQAKSIARLYNTEPLLGSQATGVAVQDYFRNPARRDEVDVVHLVCHGSFAGGLQSHLTLADGKLTAEDFFSIQLHTDLVTLSACESGVNEQRAGDELIGFTRALIYAGTPSIVASLWRVEELSTNLIMQAFYSHWDNGHNLTKARALQKAQNEIRDITVEMAIRKCEEFRQTASTEAERLLLKENIAELYFRAHAYNEAEEQYEQLIAMTTPDHALRKRWSGMLHRCAFVRNKIGGQPDFDFHPYSHPYHWASFVLLGDWR
jgi:CHAT domain-containing protein